MNINTHRSHHFQSSKLRSQALGKGAEEAAHREPSEQVTLSGDVFSKSNMYKAGGVGLMVGGFALGLSLGNALGVATTMGGFVGGSYLYLAGSLPQGNWS